MLDPFGFFDYCVDVFRKFQFPINVKSKLFHRGRPLDANGFDFGSKESDSESL